MKILFRASKKSEEKLVSFLSCIELKMPLCVSHPPPQFESFNSPRWVFHVTNFSSDLPHRIYPHRSGEDSGVEREILPQNNLLWKSKSMKDNKFRRFMFEAVKLVSPSSSSSSLSPSHSRFHPNQARQKTIKTFLIFHNPMPSQEEAEKNESSSAKSLRYRSSKPWRSHYCTRLLFHIPSLIPTHNPGPLHKQQKSEIFGNLFENDNF